MTIIIDGQVGREICRRMLTMCAVLIAVLIAELIC